MPDAVTIATEFAPAFPPQVDDISYGDRQSVSTLGLVTNGAAARFFIPADNALGTNWTGLAFNDANWKSGADWIRLFHQWPSGGALFLLAHPGRKREHSLNLVAGGGQGAIFGAAWAQICVRGTVSEFNGQNAYVAAGTIPRMNQATSSFTWSFWYHQNSVPNINSVILGNRSGGVESPLQFIKFTPTNFEYYRGESIGSIPHAVPIGSWRHLGIVKSGSALNYYDNGDSSRLLHGRWETSKPIHSTGGGDPGASSEFADGLLMMFLFVRFQP